jgi:hypothetical protein
MRVTIRFSSQTLRFFQERQAARDPSKVVSRHCSIFTYSPSFTLFPSISFPSEHLHVALFISAYIQAHLKKRFVLGIRETLKRARLGRLQTVLIAPDIEKVKEEGASLPLRCPSNASRWSG